VTPTDCWGYEGWVNWEKPGGRGALKRNSRTWLSTRPEPVKSDAPSNLTHHAVSSARAGGEAVLAHQRPVEKGEGGYLLSVMQEMGSLPSMGHTRAVLSPEPDTIL
jgi:hypothetical protein